MKLTWCLNIQSFFEIGCRSNHGKRRKKVHTLVSSVLRVIDKIENMSIK